MERALLLNLRAEAGDEAVRTLALLQPVSKINQDKAQNEAKIKKTIYWIMFRGSGAWLCCYSWGM